MYVANYDAASISVIRDSMPAGVQGIANDEFRMPNGGVTVLHTARGVMFDAQGRRVTNPGPGVCFVRERAAGSGGQYRVRKVIITK